MQKLSHIIFNKVFQLAGLLNRLSNSSLLALTLGIMLLMVLPRFNRNAAIVERPMNDARYFVAYVEYFRGLEPSDVIRPASNWRLGVPFIAAYLPFSPLTSINIVNIFALTLAVYLLYLSLRALTIAKGYCWLGCWLFLISFPTFYYTSIGYVDPGVLPFMALMVYATVRKHFLFAMLAITAGALTKETIILMLPFYFISGAIEKRKYIWLQAAILLFQYVLINWLLRKYAFVSPGEHNPSFWSISAYAVMSNVMRLNSYLAPLLSLGLPALFFYLYLKYFAPHEIIKSVLIRAVLFSLPGFILVFLLTIITTYCDGRIIWQAYFLVIPSLLYGLNKTRPLS
jgi:hypothetical protein